MKQLAKKIAIYSRGVIRLFIYKVDILDRLKAAGISTYSLTKKHGVPAATVQKLRVGDTSISLLTLDRICGLLECQPDALIKWVPDDSKPDSSTPGSQTNPQNG